MKRLTIGGHACVETLALLIAMAWADGRLDDKEKDGVRGAAKVLNLTKEMRDRLDLVLEKPIPVDQVLFDTLSARDRAFAYIAAAWMSGVDEEVDAKEEALLDEIGRLAGISPVRKAELERIARDLPPAKGEGRDWAEELVALFKSIPPRLEEEASEFEVVFE
jgi:uncharacterized membrane protein YebE (DUF533 family)